MFEQRIGFSFCLGKVVLCLYYQLESQPSYDYQYKLIKLTEESFALNRKLKKLGWCVNYMQSKD